MSYALVEDVPASWEWYAAMARRLANSPPGLLIHVAGPTDEGFRIIQIWASEADWQRFAAEVEQVIGSIDAVAVSRTVVRDLRVAHAQLGDSWPGVDPVAERDQGGQQ